MMAVSGLWVQYVTCKYRALTRILKTGVRNPSLEKVVKTGKSEFDQENLEWSFSLNMKIKSLRTVSFFQQMSCDAQQILTLFNRLCVWLVSSRQSVFQPGTLGKLQILKMTLY